MLCRVEMPMNEETYGRYFRHILLKGPDSSKRQGLYVLCPLLLLAGVGIWVMGYGLLPALLCVVVALGYAIFTLRIRPGMEFRKKEGVALQTEVYIFTETGFTRSVRHEEGGLPDNTSMRFDGLRKAVETSKDFYLFTAPNQAYIVDKEYFTKGEPLELREVLKKALGSKYTGPKT